jgi:hypothetical protein
VRQLVSIHRLDDILHEAVEDGIAELDAHHVGRHLQYFATDLIRLCARVETDTRRIADNYRVKLRFALPSTTLAAETPDDIGEQISYCMRGGAPCCFARVDDLPASEIAARFDNDDATVQPWLDHASAFQRARLSERGGAPAKTQAPRRPAHSSCAAERTSGTVKPKPGMTHRTQSAKSIRAAHRLTTSAESLAFNHPLCT